MYNYLALIVLSTMYLLVVHWCAVLPRCHCTYVLAFLIAIFDRDFVIGILIGIY